MHTFTTNMNVEVNVFSRGKLALTFTVNFLLHVRLRRDGRDAAVPWGLHAIPAKGKAKKTLSCFSSNQKVALLRFQGYFIVQPMFKNCGETGV